jgi:exoribonuclease-2
VSRYDAYRAIVRNHAKLVYEDVGAWMEGSAPHATFFPPLIAQLRLQREAAKRLKAERLRAGALELETIEARPVAKDGRIVDLAVTRKNLARDLIEDFMIAANVSIAKFLEDHKSSGIRRVVKEPERWTRIVELARERGETLPAKPDSRALAAFLARERAKDELRFPDLSLSIVKLLGRGEYALDLPGRDPGIHFGLAVHDYSHSTAPNRRYADLVEQRLVKAVLDGKPQPYSNAELTAIAAHCSEQEDAAEKVERKMRKVAAALLLQDKIGQTFDAIVTGATDHGTFVRLLKPPAEGMVIKGEHGMDVGDRVKVRLVHTDPQNGFIDFAGK